MEKESGLGGDEPGWRLSCSATAFSKNRIKIVQRHLVKVKDVSCVSRKEDSGSTRDREELLTNKFREKAER